MKKFISLTILALALIQCADSAWAATAKTDQSKDDYERSVQAVVRNKLFYKPGRFEVGLTGGVMPYDSLISHYLVGGRLTWHLSDHYGWEVLDAQLSFPSTTSFTTTLVQTKGISNLQTQRLKMLFSTNFLLSPIYGKMRFIGARTIHFDLYLVAGLGAANNDTLKLSSPGTGVAGVESIVRTGFNPMITVGMGFKIFMNDAMGLLIDLRDYIVYSPVYGNNQLKSNFSVFAGLSFFVPTF